MQDDGTFASCMDVHGQGHVNVVLLWKTIYPVDL